MGPALLVNSDRDGAEQFLMALSEAGFPIDAGLWWLDEDASRWSLLLATPMVTLAGPRTSYERVLDMASGLPGTVRTVVEAVSLVSDAHPIIRLFRSVFGPGMTHITFTQSTIGGTYVEYAYIYWLYRQDSLGVANRS